MPMGKRIGKDCDDTEVRIRFHISSARMAIEKMSFVAFQRYLDRVERSRYRCSDCGWTGPGRDLVPTEIGDDRDGLGIGQASDTWYACPRCEAVIDPDRPTLSPAD